MSDVALQIGGTKLILSVVLACAAWALHRRLRRPGAAYPMWLLVLVILLVPAFMSLPVLPADSGLPLGLTAAGGAEAAGSVGLGTAPAGPWVTETGKQALVAAWLLGAAALLGWTLVRSARFRRRLEGVLEPAPPELQRAAARIGARLGLSRIPEIHTTDARISPMVWWTGGRVRVLVPNFLLAELTPGEARSILAHELAHVRRRDYVVRWLEWIACSVFWWNPAAWWARRQLRLAEEACCDALVPAASGTSPKSYANALLRVADVVSTSPLLRAPVLASAAGGAGHTRALERRLRMIVETNTSNTPRWLRRGAWAAALFALPLGLVYCDQPEAPATPDGETMEAPAAADAGGAVQAGDGDDAQTRGMARLNQLRRDLRASVAAGEITAEQARQRISRAQQRLEAAGGESARDQASSDQPSEGDGTARLNQLKRDLRAAVAAGEITEEQARQRISRAEQRLEAARRGSGNR